MLELRICWRDPESCIRSWILLLAVYEAAPKQVVHWRPEDPATFLFDKTGNPLALIDWDTIMHGPVCYDAGSIMVGRFTNASRKMMRCTMIFLIPEFFDAIIRGYSSVLPALDKTWIFAPGRMVVTTGAGLSHDSDRSPAGQHIIPCGSCLHNLISELKISR